MAACESAASPTGTYAYNGLADACGTDWGPHSFTSPDSFPLVKVHNRRSRPNHRTAKSEAAVNCGLYLSGRLPGTAHPSALCRKELAGSAFHAEAASCSCASSGILVHCTAYASIYIYTYTHIQISLHEYMHAYIHTALHVMHCMQSTEALGRMCLGRTKQLFFGPPPPHPKTTALGGRLALGLHWGLSPVAFLQKLRPRWVA